MTTIRNSLLLVVNKISIREVKILAAFKQQILYFCERSCKNSKENKKICSYERYQRKNDHTTANPHRRSS